MFRIGNGYDVHRLEKGLPLFLGGIKIESDLGCVAHSDGDVLIHAICDALLGAMGMGDIGEHFPDNDPSFKGIDSKILLKRCMDFVKEQGYKIGNIDTVIILEKPKLRDRIDSMRGTLASVMGIGFDQISIKATTSEKIGFVGRQEGIAAYAVALITR